MNPQPREYPDFLGVLHKCMRQNGPADASSTSKDKNANTVLHLAASIFDVACVEYILKQGIATQLLETRNSRGETSVETLQFKLEELRTQKIIDELTVPVSDRFSGHDGSAVRCLILLKELGSVESLVDLQGPETLLQIAGGCTCGQCLQGFLSAWMSSHALQCLARLEHEMMNEDLQSQNKQVHASGLGQPLDAHCGLFGARGGAKCSQRVGRCKIR